MQQCRPPSHLSELFGERPILAVSDADSTAIALGLWHYKLRDRLNTAHVLLKADQIAPLAYTGVWNKVAEENKAFEYNSGGDEARVEFTWLVLSIHCCINAACCYIGMRNMITVVIGEYGMRR